MVGKCLRPTRGVAAGSTVSTFVGVLAAAVPDGARVVVPEIDFASLLFPFLVHEQRFDVGLVEPARCSDCVSKLAVHLHGENYLVVD